ncbi:MAG TPA: ATP-binding cassette domain-containing protein [Chloroflexota bacterium]|jgi:ABC-2 type transport system ATP-binding protein|nr:ATP-binding cassette domain-containing protein [Chloroflexota bacterium]
MIETRGLRRTFKSRGGPVEAVVGVDLKVAAGEVFGFLGPNGAGKTTTLRMLSTLLPPSGGQATVAGCDLLREPRNVRQRIGYVGQRNGSDPGVSARQELVFQARLYGANATQARQRAAELLTSLELDSAADRPSSTYSGGQRRRLDIGLGLIHNPQLLFLDEPTTGLDPQGRARLWGEVRRLRQTGMTVFLTTHYLEEADALCDRLAIIDHGRIVAEGTPEQLKHEIAGDVITLGLGGDVAPALLLLQAQPFVRQAKPEGEDGLRLYVDKGDAAMPAVLRLLDSAGLQLQTIAMSRPSLDDVFLQQTGHSLRDTAGEHAA